MNNEKIIEIIVDSLGCDADKVTPEARLAEDLEADSLAAAELAMALEEEFDITIEDDELKNFITVGDIINFMASKG